MRVLLAALLALAILASQYFYGGVMRTVFGLPAYFLIAVAACLSLVVVFWKRAVSPNGPAVIGVMVAGGYLLWRSLNSPGQELSIFYTFLVAACLASYLVSACALTTPASRYTFVCVLFVGVIAQAIAAAFQFTSEKQIFPAPWVSEQFRVWFDKPDAASLFRAHGFFLSGNQLAWFFNLMAFFGLGIAAFGRCRLGWKILFAYLGAVSVVGVLLTISRGGVLGLGAGMVVFSILVLTGLAAGARDRRVLFFIASAAIVLMASAGGYMIFRTSDVVQARMDRIVEDSYRQNLWRAVLRQSQLEPLTGTGAGSFTQLSRRLADRNESLNDFYAHNDWGQLASDYGFIGLALVTFAVLLNLLSGWRGFLKALSERMAISSRPQSNSAAFFVGAACAAAAAVVHSFFDYNMQVPSNAVLISVCLGFLANPGLPSAKPSLRGASLRILTALGAVACGGYLLFQLQQWAPAEVSSLLAENEMLQKRYNTAASISGAALEKTPLHSRLLRIRGESLLRGSDEKSREGQWDLGEAYSDIKRASDLEPEERWNFFLLGLTLARLEDARGAREAHIESIRLDPSSAMLCEYAGLTMELSGRVPEAMAFYEMSLTLHGAKFSQERLYFLRQRNRSR